jgi:hypothetical protein
MPVSAPKSVNIKVRAQSLHQYWCCSAKISGSATALVIKKQLYNILIDLSPETQGIEPNEIFRKRKCTAFEQQTPYHVWTKYRS